MVPKTLFTFRIFSLISICLRGKEELNKINQTEGDLPFSFRIYFTDTMLMRAESIRHLRCAEMNRGKIAYPKLLVCVSRIVVRKIERRPFSVCVFICVGMNRVMDAWTKINSDAIYVFQVQHMTHDKENNAQTVDFRYINRQRFILSKVASNQKQK